MRTLSTMGLKTFTEKIKDFWIKQTTGYTREELSQRKILEEERWRLKRKQIASAIRRSSIIGTFKQEGADFWDIIEWERVLSREQVKQIAYTSKTPSKTAKALYEQALQKIEQN